MTTEMMPSEPVPADSSCGEETSVNTSPYQFTPVPFQLESHLDFIDVHKDGTTLLGSSNIIGKVWCGSVWLFGSPSAIPQKEKSLTGYGFDACVTSGKFVSSSKKIIVGEEDGTVTLLEVINVGNVMLHLSKIAFSYSHDQLVSSISLSSNSGMSNDSSSECLRAASTSFDSSLIIWDVSLLEVVHKYQYAHTREITCCSYSPKASSSVLATVSLDGACTLWDTSQSRPASDLEKQSSSGLTWCEWTSKETELLVGNFEGSLLVYDIRMPKKNLMTYGESNSPVSCISVLPEDRRYAGVSWGQGNKSRDIIILDTESMTEVYSHTKTNENTNVYTTHLAWMYSENPTLYSVGSSLSVGVHDIPKWVSKIQIDEETPTVIDL